MRISDWSSDVCSSDLEPAARAKVSRNFGGVCRLKEVYPRWVSPMTTTYSARSFGNRGRADMKKHPVLVGVVGGIVATLLLGVAVWLAIAYTGVYNVARSEEHTSELQSLMRISYAVFCLKTKTNT